MCSGIEPFTTAFVTWSATNTTTAAIPQRPRENLPTRIAPIRKFSVVSCQSSVLSRQWSRRGGSVGRTCPPDGDSQISNRTYPTIHLLQRTTSNGLRTTGNGPLTTDTETTRRLQFPAAPPSTSRTPSDSGCLYPPARNNSSSVRICDPGPYQS